MEKMILKKEIELKQMKKIFWQHYFENCHKKKIEIKEMKKIKRRFDWEATRTFFKEFILPMTLFSIFVELTLIFSFWLWS